MMAAPSETATITARFATTCSRGRSTAVLDADGRPSSCSRSSTSDLFTSIIAGAVVGGNETIPGSPARVCAGIVTVKNTTRVTARVFFISGAPMQLLAKIITIHDEGG
jgi:Na+/H+ antiporter NhaD/arsenite permease-like protein